jgi:hypothetical protein
MIMKISKYPQLRRHVRMVRALVAASFILPALAYADHDNDRVNHWRGDNDEHHGIGDNDKHQGNQQVPVVPEANAAWVLIPFFGAVLLFSSRHLFRSKAYQNNGR